MTATASRVSVVVSGVREARDSRCGQGFVDQCLRQGQRDEGIVARDRGQDQIVICPNCTRPNGVTVGVARVPQLQVRVAMLPPIRSIVVMAERGG